MTLQTAPVQSRRSRHAADELPKLLEQLGIDAERLGQTQPLLLRDMERACALCSHKVQCDRELINGTAAETYPGYCGNASTLETLDRAGTMALVMPRESGHPVRRGPSIDHDRLWNTRSPDQVGR